MTVETVTENEPLEDLGAYERPSDEELKVYEDAVLTLAEFGTDFVFQNDNIYHAGIVIKNIIKWAEKSIRIFDQDLRGDISETSDEFLPALRDAVVVDGKTLHVVVESKVNAGKMSRIYSLLQTLVAERPNQVIVKLANREFTDAVGEVRKAMRAPQRIHFTIGDEKMYRIELPLQSRKAFCNFNSKNIAGRLADVFEDKFEDCPNYF